LKAGTDVDCGQAYQNLNQAVQQGLITESVIDVTMKRLFTLRMKLGEFDPANLNPYRSIPISVVDSPAHRKLATQVARESIVLLKNDKNILPLNMNKISRIAIIGPHANDTEVLLGNYHGNPAIVTTPLEGIKNKLQGSGIHITYNLGAQILGEGSWMFQDAVQAASKADIAIVFVGLSMKGTPHSDLIPPYSGVAIEKESLDRTDISLPHIQRDLLKALFKRQSTPIIVVLVNGGPVAIDWEKETLDTILELWYPGELGGVAIADVLFGDYNPSGRLPVTIYKIF